MAAETIGLYNDINVVKVNYLNQLIAQYKEILKSQSIAAASATYSQAQQRLQYYAWQQSVNGMINRRMIDAQRKINTDRGINFMVDISMKQALGDASFIVSEQAKSNVGLVGKVYSAAIRTRWRQITKINRQVADAAIDSMVGKYDTVRSAGRARDALGFRDAFGDVPYRASERYSGGRLRRALNSPLQASAAVNGVSFLNETLLDNAAKQWARLNFGAGPRANTAPRGLGGAVRTPDLSLKFFSAVLADSGVAVGKLTHPYGPKGAFKIPTGLWLDDTSKVIAPNMSRRGQDYFFPSKNIYATLKKARSENKGKKIIIRNYQIGKVTQGVAAWGFIEAGLSSLSRNFPAANAAWMLQIFREAQSESGAGIPGKLAIPMDRTNAIVKALESDLARYLAVSGKAGQSRLNFLQGLGNVALP